MKFNKSTNYCFLIFKKVHLLSLFCIGIPLLSFTQVRVNPFEHIGVKDGMPSGQISSIQSDEMGFLWLTTINGVVKYDGYKFTQLSYSSDDSSNLGFTSARNLYFDSLEEMWISTPDGVFKFDRTTNTLKRYHISFEGMDKVFKVINSFFTDSRDRHWISTNAGLFQFLEKQEEYIPVTSSDDNRKQPASNVTFRRIFSVLEDKQGNLWAATNRSLCKLDTASMTFLPIATSEFSAVYSIENGEDGRLWMGTDRGLYTFDIFSNKIQQINLNSEFKDKAIKKVLPDNNGGVWIIFEADMGLLYFHPEDEMSNHYLHEAENQYSLSSNRLFDLFIDKFDNLWIASYNGLNKLSLRKPKFPLYQTRPGLMLAENLIYRSWFDKDGGIYYSTYNDTVYYSVRPGTDAIKLSLPKGKKRLDRLIGFYQDSKSRTLLGFEHVGIFQANLQKQRIEPFSKELSDLPIFQGKFMSNTEDEDQIWASGTGGLFKINLLDGTYIQHQPGRDIEGTQSNSVGNCVADDKFIWGKYGVQHNAYIFRYDINADKFKKLVYPPPIDQLHIRQFALAPSGIVWFASNIGLGRIDHETDSIKLFYRSDGLLEDNLMGLTVDKDENVWIKALQHIIEYNPASDTFKHYDIVSQMREMNTVGVDQSIDGDIMMHGNNGFYIFHPDSIQVDTISPKVVLTDFKIHNRSEHLGTSPEFIDKIELAYDQNVISFEFAGLHWLDPSAHRYRYRLKNFDQNWVETGKGRIASYTNLDPGQYTFQVQASNADGIWNREGITIALRISPPWYQTTWAYLTFILFTGLLLWTMYRFRLNRSLAEAEARRLRDLDAAKTQLYTNISHEFRTPLTIILGMTDKIGQEPEKWLREGIAMVRRNSQELLQLVSQMLELSKLEANSTDINYTQGDIVIYIKNSVEAFQTLASSQKIHLGFHSEFPALYMDYDQEKLQIILSNLISNAIKYTQNNGNISIRLSIDEPMENLTAQNGSLKRYISLEVKDDGEGIHPDDLPHIFQRYYQARKRSKNYQIGTGIGLALVKELSQLLEGDIHVESTLNQGSTFTLYLPVRNQSKVSDKQDLLNPYTKEAHENIKDTIISHKDSKLILLVEDNRDVLTYLISFLQADYNLIIAPHGREGLERAIQEVPDLIISDVMMPEMDGYTLCQELKTREQTSHIPIVLLTAKVDKTSILQGFGEGADMYLEKPFDAQILLQIIQGLLKNRQKLQKYYSSYFLERKSDQAQTKERGSDEVFLDNLRQTIESNIKDESLNVDKLCVLLGTSRSQLHRKIKALTGASISPFINKIRTQKAAQLLIETQLSINEITYRVGLKNSNHLRKLFNDHYGCPPSKYRNLHRV